MELPEAVRARLVSLVAASLADVSPLPASLKQVAGFAPARRARLGATAIMSELERDDELRERVAVQVRVRATGDAGDVAVLAWLERSEGWQDAVRRVPERAAPSDGASRSSASSGSATAPTRPTGRCARCGAATRRRSRR